MAIEFGAPRVLWLLGLLPVLWLAGHMGVGRRWRAWYSVARLLLLGCLIGALAQPVLSLPASRTALVYLVDASQSVSARAFETAAQAIDAMNASVRPEASRILAFGGRTTPLADTAALRRLSTGQGADSIERLVSPDATNLEQALAAARAEIPSSTNGRILLFSDGHETEGDSLRIAQRLSAERVPVFTQPLPERDIGDTWMADVRLPRAPVAGVVSTLDLVVGSQVAQSADVVVREGSHVLARLRAPVARGESIVPVDVTFDGAGPHLVDAVVTAERDVLPDNNTLSREVLVEPRPRVLYVHTDADDAHAVPLALIQTGFQVTAARPQALPTRLEALDAWDVVVLSNVGRAQLAPEAMKALQRVGRGARRRPAHDRRECGVRRGHRQRPTRLPADRPRARVAGHVRSGRRTGGRAGHRARSLVEHARPGDGTLEGGGGSRGQHAGAGAVAGRAHVQQRDELGRAAGPRARQPPDAP